MVWQTASPSPLSPLASPQSLGCVILCLLPCRQLGNPWIFRHSADVAVFFCLKRINPSVTSLLSRFHPPTLPVFLTATATSNYMCCILKLHLTQTWASRGSFWYPAQKLCATLTPRMFPVHVPVCTRCIQFQRILDSITQPIKDHLFQCANLIRPCTDLTVFLPVSRSTRGPLRHSVAKAGPSC